MPLAVGAQTSYPVSGAPAITGRGSSRRATVPLPAVALVRVGALGTVGGGGAAGVALRSFEAALGPTALTALTW